MIAFVRGRVAGTSLTSVVLEVGGIGLELQCTPDTIAGLRHGADTPGAALLTGGLMLGVYPILQVEQHGWGSSRTLILGAVAVAAIQQAHSRSPVRVHMDGGVVEIEWSGKGQPVYIRGPAEYVCEGELLPYQE